MSDPGAVDELFTPADFRCPQCVNEIKVTVAEAEKMQAGESIQCKTCLNSLRMKEVDRVYFVECLDELASKGKAVMVLCICHLPLVVIAGSFVGPIGSLIVIGVGLVLMALIKDHYGEIGPLAFELVKARDTENVDSEVLS